jgi:hypothetical protein
MPPPQSLFFMCWNDIDLQTEKKKEALMAYGLWWSSWNATEEKILLKIE